MTALGLCAMAAAVRPHTPPFSKHTSRSRTPAAVTFHTKPSKRQVTVVTNAGYDDVGNPIGRDLAFGRGSVGEKSDSDQAADSGAYLFWGKVKAAFAIFFPVSEEETARLEAKKRLRMILVADRCSLSGGAMSLMKEKVLAAVSEFLDVDQDKPIEVATKQDPTRESLTTTYCVSIPVKGVKPEFDVENVGETYGWDEVSISHLTHSAD
jgi:septum formation topological specificity factor MinE